MALARFQRTAVDNKGNVLSGASVTVRREVAGAPLATLYTDRDGLSATGNPITTGSDGLINFHVADGSYRLDIMRDSDSVTWRYVGVSLSQEQGRYAPGVKFIYSETITDSDPGAGYFRFDNADPASATEIYVSETDAFNLDVTNWLTSLDDGGETTDRGMIIIQAVDGSAIFVGTVTGTIVDGTDYRKISVTPVTSSGTYTQNVEFGIILARTGADGTDGSNGTDGLFDGTEAQVTAAAADLVPLQDNSDSNNPKRAAVSTIGTGKQTIWIPASSMIPAATNGPESADIEGATNAINYSTLDFDATTDEYAHFQIAMPGGWDEGTVTYQVYWSTTATDTDGVAWALQAGSEGDNGAVDTPTLGTAVVVTDDAQSAANRVLITAESSAVTIGGSPAPGDLCSFRLFRDVSDANDDMTEDARLLGIKLFYTTNANTDN